LRAALVASCLRGALPPVDLRAVCFVRAILHEVWNDVRTRAGARFTRCARERA
jgi:histone H3